MTIKKKSSSVCVQIRASSPLNDKARLSNVSGQIVADPKHQDFRDTIAPTVRLRVAIYIRNVRRIQKQSRQAVQCCRPHDKVLFIYDLFYDIVRTATLRRNAA